MEWTDISILYIEDNPGDARLIREMICENQDDHPSIQLAETLKEGLKIISEKVPDIILLDLSLPDSQGVDTLHQINKLTPRTPIIVLTGLDDYEVGLQSVQKGAQDYLVKGQFKGELLRRVMHYSIERKRLLSKLESALEEIKTLSGLIPICASCKKIRDDSGYWHQIEKYISERSDAQFSHGYCPDCLKKLYPEYSKDK